METTKTSIARGHHYLSQSYLKGFTPLGTKESQLTCLDFEKRKIFTPTPKNVGKERDFNRIDLDGFEPDYLESQLSFFEDKADQAIRNIEKTRKLVGDDRILALNLIALFALRNPSRREHWNDIMDHTLKVALSMAAANVGGTSNGILITEEFKQFVDEGKFQIKVPRQEHIDLELRTLDEIILSLVHRKWALIEAPQDAAFVTCDRAVALIWTEHGKYSHSPGFALHETEVHFALSKRFALVGSFEGTNETVIVSKEQAALINSNILLQTHKRAYSPSENFYFLNPTGDTLFGIEKFWKEFKHPSLFE